MRVADIPPERLNLLNTGQAESTTLTECLAVDFAALMRATFPDIGQERLSAMQAASGAGITRRMALAAKLIHDAYPQGMVTALCQHKSDTLRGWACYLIAEQEDMPLRTRLMSMRCLADDAHFGVREWAWLAVRPYIAADLDDAISELSVWALDPSERIRRFASEAIRPRGVWCAHLTPLRQRPEQALPVLEPLRADPAAYVQDSVGNWLNDASKDQPGWVQSLCDRWQQENGTPATARICKRALRSIAKKKQT